MEKRLKNKILEQICRDRSLISCARFAYSSRIDDQLFYIANYKIGSLFYEVVYPLYDEKQDLDFG